MTRLVDGSKHNLLDDSDLRRADRSGGQPDRTRSECRSSPGTRSHPAMEQSSPDVYRPFSSRLGLVHASRSSPASTRRVIVTSEGMARSIATTWPANRRQFMPDELPEQPRAGHAREGVRPVSRG
jgi:hypothetical protein